MANGCGVLCGVGDVFGGVAGSAETADAAAAHAILPAATPIGQRLRGRHRLGAGGPPIIGESIFGNLIRDGDAAPQVPDPSWTGPSADEPHAILPSIPVAPAGMARVDQPVPATMPWMTQGIFGGAVRRGDYGYTRLGGGVSGFGATSKSRKSPGGKTCGFLGRPENFDPTWPCTDETADSTYKAPLGYNSWSKAGSPGGTYAKAVMTGAWPPPAGITVTQPEPEKFPDHFEPTGPPPVTAGSSTMLWVGVGVVALGAVAGAVYFMRKRGE